MLLVRSCEPSLAAGLFFKNKIKVEVLVCTESHSKQPIEQKQPVDSNNKYENDSKPPKI